MQLFAELIGPGDTVVEVGGHIGYLTVYLAQLAGPMGRVHVFEPGTNNLPYVRRNTAGHPHVRVHEQAVSDRAGVAQFHLENNTGQNNSLLEQCRVRRFNEATAFVNGAAPSTVEVSCTTLDAFLQAAGGPRPAFVKIDVEGAELLVLRGMPELLRAGPALMVEVTENAEDVLAVLGAASYQLFNDRRQSIDSPRRMRGNVFCLRAGDPRLARFSP
jgi:FkbM family methyltransferase